MQNISESDNNLNWKKTISETLRMLGFIDKKFAGKIVININQGGITDIEKTQKMK